MDSARTAATTTASSNTSPAISHPAAKEEAAAVGGAGEVEEAVEEDVALQVPASKTIKMLPQPATGRLRAATTASSRRSLEWSGASHTRDSSGS